MQDHKEKEEGKNFVDDSFTPSLHSNPSAQVQATQAEETKSVVTEEVQSPRRVTYVEVKSETNATEAPNQAVQEQKQEEENQMKKKKKKNKKRR